MRNYNLELIYENMLKETPPTKLETKAQAYIKKLLKKFADEAEANSKQQEEGSAMQSFYNGEASAFGVAIKTVDSGFDTFP